MTERTIRSMAKQLAGAFYEDNRSAAFRQTFPTLKSYMRGQWHNIDGVIVKIDKPGWMHHIEMARKVLTHMLSLPDARVSPRMKESIYDALIEEHARATKPTALKTTQRKEVIPFN